MNWKDYFSSLSEYNKARNNNTCFKCKKPKEANRYNEDFCKKCNRAVSLDEVKDDMDTTMTNKAEQSKTKFEMPNNVRVQ